MAVSIYAIYAQPEMVFQPTKGSGCLTGLTLSHTPARPVKYNFTNDFSSEKMYFGAGEKMETRLLNFCLRLRTKD